MSDILSQTLNRLFAKPVSKKRSGLYVASGPGVTALIGKRNGLWSATVASGRTYSNSILGDLKQQLRDECGFTKFERHPG